MGFLRFGRLRLTEAQIEFEKALALDPNNAFALVMAGHTLRDLGRPASAIPYFERAIPLSLGQVDEAIDYLLKARAAAPSRVPRRRTATPGLFSAAYGEVSSAHAGFVEDGDATSLQCCFYGRKVGQ